MEVIGLPSAILGAAFIIGLMMPGTYELCSVLREIRDHLKRIADQGEPWNRHK